MSHAGAHVHSARTLFAVNIDKNTINKELNATKVDWSQWFHQAKAFDTIDSRSYAQVLKSTSMLNSPKLPQNGQLNKCKPRPSTLVNTGLVNKVLHHASVNPQRSLSRTSVNTPYLPVKESHTNIVSTHNRYQVLYDLHTDDSELSVNNDCTNHVKFTSFSPRDTAGPTKVRDKCNSTKASRDQKYSQKFDCDDFVTTSERHPNISRDVLPTISTKVPVNTTNQSIGASDSEPGLLNAGFEPTYANTAIPLPIWENRVHSADYNRSVAQNGNVFGALPITDQIVYEGPPTTNAPMSDILQAHSKIRQSQLPNFLGCRIPVKGQLHAHIWREYLSDYWDKQLPDLIDYGFPLDFDRTCPLLSTDKNHSSAQQFPQDIEVYLDNEVAYNAMYGPFTEKPIHMHISPLMTREKPGSDNRRTIVDLSWPHGSSVNHGVEKNRYLQAYYHLSYPSVDHIVDYLKRLGPGALIYKVDISRAFRHLRIDPGDLDLLGLHHKSYYLDGSLAFGFRHGSFFFQKCSDAIRYIMKKFGYPNLLNYIDDLIYIGLPSNITASYEFLLRLLHELGLDISQNKLVAPSTSVVCLGILVDSVNRTISIPEGKLAEIVKLCNTWVDKTSCTKSQLQSLLGSLLYITKCVRPARFFLNRMLQVLRDNHSNGHIRLTEDFAKDLNWFNTFLCSYNGVTFYDNKPVQAVIELDASFTGLGAVFQNMIYALPLPQDHLNYNIAQLEMLNIMVALKVWGYTWQNMRIEIKCDNLAVVQVLQEGKARDPLLATIARNIWMLTSVFNIHLSVSHIAGKNNATADLLSRWWVTENRDQKLSTLLHSWKWIPTHIDLLKLNHSI